MIGLFRSFRSQIASSEFEVDVAVIGAGPGGTLLAYLLAEQHGRSAKSERPNGPNAKSRHAGFGCGLLRGQEGLSH